MLSNSINLHEVLQSLAQQRPIFHSEADFQHSFAWLIQQKFPDAAIRLELPFEREEHSRYLDIWVSTPIRNFAFELKYKTRKTTAIVNGEEYRLKNHGAQDVNRYAVLNDVERLEHLIFSHNKNIGYAIFVTNDSGYWTHAIKSDAIDADFRLHDKREIHGLLSWGRNASTGTTKGVERPIDLKGRYVVEWRDYSELPQVQYGRFRYLVVEIASTA